MQETTCCFIGHRKINEIEELKTKIYETVENLIKEHGVNTFLFGSASEFNSLCIKTVTKIKEKYPHIKRIYVRAEFPYINDSYKAYLLRSYDDTYYPEKILNAGKDVYVERNREMIDQSSFCIVYYDENSIPADKKSGTKTALDYAVKTGKKIFVYPSEALS